MDKDIGPCPKGCTKCQKPTSKGTGYKDVAKHTGLQGCKCQICIRLDKEDTQKIEKIRTTSKDNSHPKDTSIAETNTPDSINIKVKGNDNSIKAVKKKALKSKPVIKTKKNISKKIASPLYPILCTEERTRQQDITKLLVYERHKTFSDSNTKHARNPLLTKGRVSKAVADPSLRTTELLEIAQGKI